MIATTVAIAHELCHRRRLPPQSGLGSLVWGAALGLACLPRSRAGNPARPPPSSPSPASCSATARWSSRTVGRRVLGTDRRPDRRGGFCGAGAVDHAGRGRAPGPINRHIFEAAVIRFCTGFGYIFFTAIVLIPFYVMVLTSLKNQSELIQNPLDFSHRPVEGDRAVPVLCRAVRPVQFRHLPVEFLHHLGADGADHAAVRGARAPMPWRGCGSAGGRRFRARSC